MQFFGVLVSLVAVLAILTQLYPERLLEMTFNGGDLIIILNRAFWAVYCACLRLRPAVHTMSFLLAVAPISAAATLPFAASMPRAWAWRPGPRAWHTTPSL